MSIEDIIAALARSDRADLVDIRRYIVWVRIRRQVHHRFYFQAHWVTTRAAQLPACRAHWI